jgi:DNA-3-methyladenine glycosylase
MADLIKILSGPVLEAAPRLLGATLQWGDQRLMLTEVEAYDGANDPGSHAFRGPTARNQVMFGPAGFLYVYLVYGMHHCANVSCGPSGTAAGVLMRAGVLDDGTPITGPARLCKALGVTREDNGADLRDRLQLPDSMPEYSTGPRVGLRAAADRPWRFWITGHESVSRYTPAKPRVKRAGGAGES